MDSFFNLMFERSRKLRPSPNYPTYPPYHVGPYMEEFFLEKYLTSDLGINRILIPILWTNCYLTHVGGIQEYLDALDKTKKYFTVSQHDDAIRERLPVDTIAFNGGGNGGGIPIPLICSPIPDVPTKERDIFCSFVGSVTHPIRNHMCSFLGNDPRFKIFGKIWEAGISKDKLDHFVDITARSKFSLCPRGYGKTSFRLYEAIQLGAIPVYIYDDIWLPFTDFIDWDTFSVNIHFNDLGKLPDILNSYTDERINHMRGVGKQVWEQYFSMDGMVNGIVKSLKEKYQ